MGEIEVVCRETCLGGVNQCENCCRHSDLFLCAYLDALKNVENSVRNFVRGML